MNSEPNFESIKHTGKGDEEYWLARELAPLLGYTRWENFDTAIKRAMIACQQIGQDPNYQFRETTKLISSGKGAKREVKDFILTRFACYLIAQNGDPRKPEIAAAQAYFATATRENELHHIQRRVELRERVSDGNAALKDVAHKAGVLSRHYKEFESAGYEGLYGGMKVEEIKEKKGIDQKEDILDRMGHSELAANYFRTAQTEEKLRREQIIGQNAATETHREVSQKVRKAIQDIGGTMPEELPSEPTIKPLLKGSNRKKKKLKPADKEPQS
jgi:DNA-damage-inducible protein D